jgi:hypothetical protein
MARILLAVAALTLAACQPQQQQQAAAPPAEPAAPAQPAEKLDPFVVMVDAERWGVIIDKAREGVREAPDRADANSGSEMFRADAALKSSAASLLELRNAACAKGLVTGAACDLKDWPAWTREAPTASTPIEEIDRRSQWLGETMQPFTDVGCEAGRKATKDDLFCSVE